MIYLIPKQMVYFCSMYQHESLFILSNFRTFTVYYRNKKLFGRGPLMWMMSLHLHINQKSDYDMMIVGGYL